MAGGALNRTLSDSDYGLIAGRRGLVTAAMSQRFGEKRRRAGSTRFPSGPSVETLIRFDGITLM